MSDWLDSITVASPCPAEWDKMTGDDQCRYCASCRLNVYKISEMTRQDAKALILEKEGVEDGVCIQLCRRKDGTIMTQDCPVGVLRFRRRIVKVFGALAASLTLFFGIFGVARATSNGAFDMFIHSKPKLSKLYWGTNPVEKISDEGST